VEAEDTSERVNITQLNSELKATVARIDQLRPEIEGEGVEA
jgi:type I restriction enzyme M protein